MTVGELIEKLQQFDKSKTVMINCSEWGFLDIKENDVKNKQIVKYHPDNDTYSEIWFDEQLDDEPDAVIYDIVSIDG